MRRGESVKRARWETGSVLSPEVERRLGESEKMFFRQYDDVLAGYIGKCGLDLTADLVPPKELYVEIRVLEDCGEIMTESGSVMLERGTTHHLRRSDVEHLIRKGYLEQTRWSNWSNLQLLDL
jgi:GINS complex subunit 1